MKRLPLLALLLLAPECWGQTLKVEPALARQDQAIIATLSDVPALPPGAADEKTEVTLDGGEVRACNQGTLYLWHGPGKGTLLWKRTAHVVEKETYFSPGPSFDPAKPRIEDLILKQRVVSDTPVVQSATATVEVEGVAPQPPDPPQPPTPKPPIPEPGLHVLMLYESGDKLPEAKLQTLYSTAIRGHVAAKNGLIRFYDKDQEPPEAWVAAAMKRPRTEIPWWIYSDGKTGGEGPLPDEATALKALNQLGGGR